MTESERRPGRLGPEGSQGVLGVLGLLAALTACSESAAEEEPTHVLVGDARVAPLLRDCEVNSYYDRFVGDMTPILIEKLQVAGGEPLRRAKEELGAGGEPAAKELRRLVDQSFSNAFHGPHLENALDAASMNDTPTAHALLLHSLDHPMESVRHRALLGLVAKHALPADWELFRFRFEGSETTEIRRLFLRGMFVADRERSEALCLEWIASGSQRPFWIDFIPQLSESTSAETAARCAELFDQVDVSQAAALAAPAARFGDEAALDYLHEELEAEEPSRRIAAVRGLTAAGRALDLERAVDDPDSTVLTFVIDGLANADEVTEDMRAWLLGLLSSGSPSVRAHALKELCRLKEPAAIDQALSSLGENPRLLGDALMALRVPLKDEGLSRRAFELLLERNRLEELRPVQEQSATFKALGLVQLRDAARFLREKALAHPGEVIESLRMHDWMMIQASNTGREGRTYLWEQLQLETDPVRRIDLIGAIASIGLEDERELARERLLELCEGEAISEYEILYAASKAVKIGPAFIVAPRLKGALADFETPSIQVAMQCLLWKWY